MKSFAPELTNLSANSMPSKSIPTLIFWFWFGLYLIMYSLPWISNPGRSLSLGAYDLAEWSSLHPTVKATTPPLLTCFLIRFPLVGLAWIVGFHSKDLITKPMLLPLVHTITVVLIAISLLPPLEFFTIASGDPNYQQQFVLAIAASIGGVIGLSGLLKALQPIILPAIILTIVLTSVLGLSQSLRLMLDFQLPSKVGIGGAGLISLCVIFSLFQVFSMVKQTR